jgi:hypothetical protein
MHAPGCLGGARAHTHTHTHTHAPGVKLPQIVCQLQCGALVTQERDTGNARRRTPGERLRHHLGWQRGVRQLLALVAVHGKPLQAPSGAHSGTSCEL